MTLRDASAPSTRFIQLGSAVGSRDPDAPHIHGSTTRFSPGEDVLLQIRNYTGEVQWGLVPDWVGDMVVLEDHPVDANTKYLKCRHPYRWEYPQIAVGASFTGAEPDTYAVQIVPNTPERHCVDVPDDRTGTTHTGSEWDYQQYCFDYLEVAEDEFLPAIAKNLAMAKMWHEELLNLKMQSGWTQYLTVEATEVWAHLEDIETLGVEASGPEVAPLFGATFSDIEVGINGFPRMCEDATTYCAELDRGAPEMAIRIAQVKVELERLGLGAERLLAAMTDYQHRAIEGASQIELGLVVTKHASFLAYGLAAGGVYGVTQASAMTYGAIFGATKAAATEVGNASAAWDINEFSTWNVIWGALTEMCGEALAFQIKACKAVRSFLTPWAEKLFAKLPQGLFDAANILFIHIDVMLVRRILIDKLAAPAFKGLLTLEFMGAKKLFDAFIESLATNTKNDPALGKAFKLEYPQMNLRGWDAHLNITRDESEYDQYDVPVGGE